MNNIFDITLNEVCKMKKIIMLAAVVICFLGLSGCYTHTHYTHPGTVLGSAPGTVDANKIITFNVIGKGVEPEASLTKGQAVIMAERAAIADGYRQFVEKIKGVYVDAYMKAGYGSVDWEAVNTSTRSWLRGVELIAVKHGVYGIAEAHMQLRVNFINNNMIWWPAGLGDKISASL